MVNNGIPSEYADQNEWVSLSTVQVRPVHMSQRSLCLTLKYCQRPLESSTTAAHSPSTTMSDGFKVPSLPHTGPSKRKYPEDSNGTSNKRSRPTVEDESDPVAAPSSSKTKRTYNFAPSIPIKSSAGSVTTDVGAKARQIDEDDVEMRGDETFEADEGDEEGRFFGGGTNETQEVRIDS